MHTGQTDKQTGGRTRQTDGWTGGRTRQTDGWTGGRTWQTAHTYLCIHTYIGTYIHTYIHACMHTYTCALGLIHDVAKLAPPAAIAAIAAAGD